MVNSTIISTKVFYAKSIIYNNSSHMQKTRITDQNYFYLIIASVYSTKMLGEVPQADDH